MTTFVLHLVSNPTDVSLASVLRFPLPQSKANNYRTFRHPVFDRWMQMKPDLEKYRAMMPKNDCSTAEQDDVLLALWAAMEAIVDREFDEHPSQQISHQVINKVGVETSDLVESTHTLKTDTDEEPASKTPQGQRKLRRKPTKRKTDL
ncbi:MAG: hypothetical protein AAGE89_15010 [Pseudomonadota bacterium]